MLDVEPDVLSERDIAESAWTDTGWKVLALPIGIAFGLHPNLEGVVAVLAPLLFVWCCYVGTEHVASRIRRPCDT